MRLHVGQRQWPNARTRNLTIVETLSCQYLYGLWLKDATVLLLDFTDHEVSICGQTNDGRAVMLRLEEIVELEILEVSERLE